jgi:hypothetical protein
MPSIVSEHCECTDHASAQVHMHAHKHCFIHESTLCIWRQNPLYQHTSNTRIHTGMHTYMHMHLPTHDVVHLNTRPNNSFHTDIRAHACPAYKQVYNAPASVSTHTWYTSNKHPAQKHISPRFCAPRCVTLALTPTCTRPC